MSVVLSAIGSLSQTEEIANLSVATQATQAAIERAESEVPSLDRHDVVFFSDLTRNTWLASSEEQSRLDELAKRASLTVIDVGGEPRNNLAVVDLNVEPAILMSGQEVTFSATLQNFGDREWNDLEVEFIVYGRSVETQQVSLSVGGVLTVRFVYQFRGEGPHTVQVSVTDEIDSLSLDNRRWLVVEEIGRAHV